MSRFFIDRPIFAWVIAVMIMLAGALAIATLPIAQYPAVAPPAVVISARYPGADAQTLENAVTAVIEQQMKGLDHLEYLSSTSDSSGSVQITLTFTQNTNPDIAQVQTQNKLQLATPLLPQEVQQQGVVVAKASANYLLIVGLYSADNSHSDTDLADLLVSRMQDPLSRVTGVGDTQVFGSQYAMRIWLNPLQLNSYNLTPGDVKAAVLAQNAQVPAGQLNGAPFAKGQLLNAIVSAQSRLQTPQQFADIVLKTAADGSVVRVRDVAHVELGQDSYSSVSRYNGRPAAGFLIKLAPGANALATVDAVKARVAELAPELPSDVKVFYPVDSTSFVRLSIRSVVETLIEAVILVFIVMFLFLQNWRATLIPTIAVPIVLLGTFGVLSLMHYSINVLTLFAMVLAIGLLVDDAIVVVENVERIIEEEGLSPKEAARKSMDEITGALVGIALVLTAVFLPMAFFGGSTGVIYRQFSVTIVSAMVLSVIVALVLTPALCATILRAPKKGRHRPKGGFFGWFNRTFDRSVHSYERGLRRLIRAWLPFGLAYLAVVGVLVVLFVRLPTGFLPDEDQGQAITLFQLPAGADFARTDKVARAIEHHFLVDEKADVEGLFTAQGFSFAGSGQNAGLAFALLSDWSKRRHARDRAPAIAQRAMAALSQVPDAQVFTIIPPAVQELGNASGFDFELEDRGAHGHAALSAARDQLLGMAAKDPALVGVRPNGLPDVAQLKVDVDTQRAGALGLNLGDVNDTLTTAWGGAYVNDFLDRGRIKRVYVQGDAAYRTRPEDLGSWFVRGAGGTMTPFSAFATTRWIFGPSKLERYNGLPSAEIQGQAAPGVSSGAALAKMEALAKKLPAGFGYDWTGLSFEEKASGGQAPLLYALSILVVFLCLAALYESWTVPIAIVLVIPLGIVGAVLAATMRGLANDVYFQVGLLTTMGLAAKNAILIVEFAEGAEREGKPPVEAAVEGAKLRLRPILMTSLAFIAGVFPLAISTGAGSGGQNDIGTGVVGGMLSATVLAIFFVPLFFVLVRRTFGGRPSHTPADALNDANAGTGDRA